MLIRSLPRTLVNLLFRSFEAKESFVAQVAEIRQKNPGRPMAFAIATGGLFEFLAIRFALLERFGNDFDLRYATRLPHFYFDSPWTWIRRVASQIGLCAKPTSRILACSHELSAGRPIALFFESDRGKAFETPRSERDFAYLLQQNPDLLVVPVVIIWRRAQRNERDFSGLPGARIVKRVADFSPWALLLGDPYNPSGLRKVFIMLRQYGRSSLRALDAIELSSLPPKALRRKVLMALTQEKRTILGPGYKSPKLLGESILRDPGFQQYIRTVAAEEGESEIVLFKRAERAFREIAANYKFFWVESLARVMDFVIARIYEDITLREEDFDRIRALSKDGPVIFVPCHRSYLDFLLLSYMLFRKDILPPHIAAGINLNFWPLGHMFKGAGAFFIRRSFRGNRIYGEVLRRYVAVLLSNRFNLEFFIEGARSRSGKLAPPKYGILKMIMDSHAEGLVSEKLRIMPVSLSYDRVTETRSHKRELEGGEKVQENVLNTLKAGSVLFRRYGKAHIRFGEPINFEDWMAEQVGAEGHDGNIRKLALQKLAFEICHRINRETPLTATGLVCAVLLAKQGCAMSKAELESWLEVIQKDLQGLGTPLNPDLQEDFLRTCRRALARLLDEKIVERYHLDRGVGIRIPHKQRVAALYYKNSVIHALLIPGIAGLSQRQANTALEVRALMQFEFFFADKDSFLHQIASLPEGMLTGLYGCMLEDTIENISLGIGGLLAMKGLWLDVKEWRNRLMKHGRTRMLESSVARLEAVNTQSFAAFLDLAQNRGWLKPSPNEANLFCPARLDDLAAVQSQLRNFLSRPEAWDALRQKHLPHIANA